MSVFDDRGNFWKGMKVTLRQMGKTITGSGLVTTRYPDEMREKPQRFHGRHVLNRYEDGMEKCIGCELCAGACPARCIYVRGADNPEDMLISPGERFGFVYEINLLRCIFCGLCVEACPTEAIVFGNINDSTSRVASLQKNNRAYEVLDELNTRPRTKYLALLRNPGKTT